MDKFAGSIFFTIVQKIFLHSTRQLMQQTVAAKTDKD